MVRESEGGEYNGEAGWERVDRDFRLRSRNKCAWISLSINCWGWQLLVTEIFLFRNPYYLWEVAGVVPCRRHTVRLYLGENFIEVQPSFDFESHFSARSQFG